MELRRGRGVLFNSEFSILSGRTKYITGTCGDGGGGGGGVRFEVIVMNH